jgi:tripartite-type tricarboxylate transporter receptor subunit TctC
MKRLISWAARLLALAMTVVGVTSAHAQQYPDRPVRLVVPFPPGGSTDIMARLFAQKLGDALGQRVYIDNRGGAGGRIGTDFVAKALPDGYTLMMDTGITHTASTGLYKKLPYDVLTDFAPITMLASEPLLIVVHPSVPANTLGELVALAKAKPGELNYSSQGNGTSGHLAMELLKSMAAINVVHVPYQGGGPAVLGVVSGQVQMLIQGPEATLPFVKAGKLKALAITSLTRSPDLPNIPTASESGLSGYEAALWFGLYAPAKTPSAIINRLNQEASKIMHSPEMRARLAGESGEPVGNTPEQFQGIIKRDVEKWGAVIKEAGIKVE